MICFFWSIRYFCDEVRYQTSNQGCFSSVKWNIFVQKLLLELIKRREKVHENNISGERPLNFDLWKTFSENFNPLKINLWGWHFQFCSQNYGELLLVTFRRVQTQTQEVFYLHWRNTYSNLKAIFHINPKIFLSTKILQNFLLAKYLLSVAVSLIRILCIFNTYL